MNEKVEYENDNFPQIGPFVNMGLPFLNKIRDNFLSGEKEDSVALMERLIDEHKDDFAELIVAFISVEGLCLVMIELVKSKMNETDVHSLIDKVNLAEKKYKL